MYEGEVKIVPVLETATDLLVMHEEVVHLQNTVSALLHSGRRDVVLRDVVFQRQQKFVQAQQITSGVAPPTDFSHPPSHTPVAPGNGVSSAQYAAVTTQPPDKQTYDAHEMMHRSRQTYPASGPDCANIAGAPGNLQTEDTPPVTKGYANLTIGEYGVQPHLVLQSHPAGYQHPLVQVPRDSQLPPHSTESEQLYHNLPGPLHQNPALSSSGGGWEGPRASQPTYFQNIPPPLPNLTPPPSSQSVSQGGGSWEGPRASQPTHFQNVAPTTGAPDSTPVPTDRSHLPPSPFGSSHETPRPVAPSPPKPVPTPRKPRNKPQQTAAPPPPPAVAEETGGDSAVEDVENQNIHGISIKMRQTMGSVDSMAANLPPPVVDFNSPFTPCESGLLSSGLAGFESTVGLTSIGPMGFGDSQPARSELDNTAATTGSVTTSQQTVSTASASSIDIYGSDTEQQLKQQQSHPTVEEEGDEGLIMSVENPPHPLPAIVTEDSLDRQSHRLPTEREASLQRDSYSKSRSVDLADEDNKRQQGRLRHVKSGSNLAEMAANSRQGELEKPKPSPRSSRSSTPSSLEQSPAGSPDPPARKTHENWNPPTPPSPLATDRLPKLLPRQARSVDVVEKQRSSREVPRFSSGTDLLSGSKPLPPVGQLEPETPVLGVAPGDWIRTKSANTQPPRPHTLEPVHPDTHPRGRWSEHQQIPQGQEQQDPSEQLQHQLQERGAVRVLAEQQKQLEEEESKRRLEREREEAQMRLQREREEKEEAQRELEQEKEEKEKAQRELRDLKLRIAEAERKKREHPRPQFPCWQQKSVAVVSPTTAEAKAIISKPEESCLDHGGERRGVQQYPGEGKPRERANASARDLRAKQHHAEKETSFIDKHTHTDSKPQLPDVATHIDLENTWVCNYCTQLNPDTHTRCDVCKSPDPRRSWLCSRCQNTNPDSLPQCKNCRKLKETLV